MSKRKPARTIKARSASKIRSNAAGSGQPKGRASSKQARVLALLCGPNGATIATVTRSTGWQPHTVRAFLAAVVRKKLGLRLESEKTDGERVYRICCRQGFRRCHECAECVAMRGHSTNPAAIEAEIAHLRSLALDALRRHWRVIFGRTPLAALSKDFLGRMIAYRLQERAFGGLDRESLRFLDGLARHGGSRPRRLKPGTVLVRDYQGQRHTVTVVSDGFDWQGATYPSLSAIARAITGTAWSGPRFFALARGNGAPARRNKNASAREGRDGSQPARGMNVSEMNTASLPLQTASHAVNLKP